jgi:rRNA processing protein Krr1/Pno1
MVGMTSALGRALGYMGCGVSKSIASRNEVEARLDGHEATITPMRTPKEGSVHASSKQLYMIKALAKGKGLDDLAALEAMQLLLDADDVILETLTMSQASKVIEAWKQ